MSTVKDLFIQYIHDNVTIHDNYSAIVLIRQVKIFRVFAAVVGFYVREADVLYTPGLISIRRSGPLKSSLYCYIAAG